MVFRVAIETIENVGSWASSEELEQYEKALSLNESIPMPDDSDQEQPFSKSDKVV